MTYVTSDRFYWMDEDDSEVSLNDVPPPQAEITTAKSGKDKEMNDMEDSTVRPLIGPRTAKYFGGNCVRTIVDKWSEKPRGCTAVVLTTTSSTTSRPPYVL